MRVGETQRGVRRINLKSMLVIENEKLSSEREQTPPLGGLLVMNKFLLVLSSLFERQVINIAHLLHGNQALLELTSPSINFLRLAE